MTYNEAIRKAAALLRLSQSNNAHEAARAAAKAQEIIDRYEIEAEMLNDNGPQHEPDEPIKDFGSSDPIEPGCQHSSWKTRLLSSIARHNGCRIYLKGGGGFGVVGRPSGVQSVRYLYGYMRGEVDRLTERDCRGNGRTYCNNFRLGVVDTIDKRLDEQHKETQRAVVAEIAAGIDSSVALVQVNKAIAKIEQRYDEAGDWMKANMKLRSGRGSSSNYNGEARAAGQRAGREIAIGKAKAALS